MQATIPDLTVWLIVGLLAGSLAGLVIKRKKQGYGHFINLGLGLVGALIGGFLFDLFNIDFGLANITISLQDIVSAFVGSLVFLALLFFSKKWYANRN
ncbi:MAG: GlsB/YeaQ/YmgE family stress response membrane protein [Halioglobus sp.]